MDFSFTPEQKLLRDSVRELMKRYASPDSIRQHDRDRTFPYDLYDAWVEADLVRLAFPEEYGGLGGTVGDLVIVVEELSRVSTDLQMAFGDALFCGLNILRNGTEAQKRYWLPKLMDGEIKMAIAISEPDAGSDVGSLRSTARRQEDRWIINGQKVWISGAALKNTVICTYVRTNPTAHYRDGVSLFLVDNDMSGVEMRKLEMLGRRCFGTYEVFFNDVEVPPDRLVGSENKGWDYLLSGLKFERTLDSAMNVGGAQAIVDLAAQYGQERSQFGRPIGSFQAIAHMIADMQTEVEAARSLTWRAGWLAANDQDDALRVINMAKLFSSEVYAKLGNMGVQIMGAIGLNAECDMQRYFRDSRSATIQAGTSQMQRTLIAGLMGLKSR
ncbi:MAG: acyl-CoA dehydrogenase family protein [Candidatus Korobacteraceae bacterium]|jgi:alkylation response protein AidB-like acyl-CoA dehydrogenase